MDASEEIIDENGHDDESPKGYYTRSKRRRLMKKNDGGEEGSSKKLKASDKSKNEVPSTSTSSDQIFEIGKRKNPIMHVPTEVLFCIFNHISYHELSHIVRLVNRRFKTVAESMLNLGFKKIKQTVDCLITSTNDAISYTSDDTEMKSTTKMLNFLEILRFQHALIMATIWRYVYNEYYKTNRTCMYGGMVIDVYKQFFWKFSHNPYELYGPAITKEYTLPEEVTKIIQLSKTFCVHFDKVNEELMRHGLIFSGCKILDILNCAFYAQKTVYSEGITEDFFTAKYTFYFKNSWFIRFPIPPAKWIDWNQKQRLMHMRLRRIVFAHNDMFLQQEQYERESALRPNAPAPIKKPGNNVYTGFGDVEDLFFFYGVMNDGAYVQKFNLAEDLDDDDEEEVDDQFPFQAQELQRENSDQDFFYRIPYSGFGVSIDVKCPAIFSPLEYLKKLSDDQLASIKKTASKKGWFLPQDESPLTFLRKSEVTMITMNFDCFGAYYPRLPCQYRYEFQSRRYPESKSTNKVETLTKCT